jgi:hypothetical protein
MEQGNADTARVTLPEELVLLVVEDDGGIAYTAGSPGFSMAVVGACLVELNLVGAIDADLEALRVLDATPGRGEALDRVIRELAAGPEARVDQWVLRLFPLAQQLIRASLDSLIARGILARSERRFLWVLKERSYPIQDDREQKEAKRRIIDTLLGDEIPTPHDTVLLGLAIAGGLLEAFLSHAEIARLQDRMSKVGGVDLIVRGVDDALKQDQLIRAQSMVYPF